MQVSRWVASGFGSGLAPFAPGTFGSLLGLAIGGLLLGFGNWPIALAALVATVAGLWAIRASGARDDPGWVVIDEIAGILIAMVPLPRPSLAGLAAAFVLFRLLDITKPGPIGWADRQHGAIGVMADDVIAGVAVAAVLWLVVLLEPRWLS